MQKATYKFVYNRKGKLNKEKKALIHIEIYAGSWRKWVSTNIYLEPKQWDKARRQVNSKNPHYKEYNRRMRQQMEAIEAAEMECITDNITFNSEALELKKDQETGNFIAFCNKFNRLDAAVSFDTLKARRTGIECFKKSGLFTHFKDVTLDNVKAYDAWLRKPEQNYKPSTIAKRHAYLRQFIRAAMPNYIKQNPYEHFVIRKGAGEDSIKYLEFDELQNIESLVLFNKHLLYIRDLFLFQCYTGIAYADLFKLNPNMLHTDADGDLWIIDHRKKSAQQYQVYVTPKANEILQRNSGGAMLFRSITNQKYNEALKELSRLASVKSITSHMGRHTFATQYLEQNNGDIDTLAKILGHSTTKTTALYAKVLKGSIKKGMKRMG